MKKSVLVVTFLLFASFAYAETYEEWLATCKDYKDVAKWQETNFKYDMERFGEARKLALTYHRKEDADKRIVAYSPEETFNRKSGVCFDAAIFSKHSLNKVNPEYKAEIIYLAATARKGT